METRIAMIGIIVANHESVDELNTLLSEYGSYIVGRMGIPYRERNVSIISIAMDAPNNVISALSGKIGMLPESVPKPFTQKYQINTREEKTTMKELIDQLKETQWLNKDQWTTLIENRSPELSQYLFEQAREVRHLHYKNDIYIRGLIEFTNYCKNDCLYCGIRRSNKCAVRYRISKEDILNCCEAGYSLGFRTFVLQGGEDGYFTDARLADIVSSIKALYPDCAVTLSVGEKPYESYLAWHKAGADRYLLRHETYNAEHYGKLHPASLTASHRRQCLWDLKEIGYQVGTGFMVGSPYQTAENLAEDMLFIKELNPHMVGIGPFIPHHDTPFADRSAGTLELTLFMLGLLRLMLPKVLLPSTTALGTIDPNGRELGILAGANVVMPNLSPSGVRKNYLLYDNKICMGDEAAESVNHLKDRMKKIGYDIVVSRGDSLI